MRCRHCSEELKLPFLDLGSAPPSNAYLTEAGLNVPEHWYPLRLLVCENCWLVQTEDHAGRENLFTEDYAYFSSFSTSWLAHASAYVDEMKPRFELNSTSCVVEVAANDGYLLQYVKAAGIPCYGIEPTAGTAAAARKKGIEIVEQFFGVELANGLVRGGRQADLIIANNVLAHVPDINDFVHAFVRLLKPAGVATFEFPHLLRMVEENQFDTAYHEHYSYLSLTAVEEIFKMHGLMVFNVEKINTHGGSLRVFAQRGDQRPYLMSSNVQELLAEEASAGVAKADFYRNFQQAAIIVKNNLLEFLLRARREGMRVAAYGAAAKGNTLLNFAGIKSDLLSYVVDKNPQKQGKYLPGSRIPVAPEARLRDDRPDYVLILPWNLRTEVCAQLMYIRDWGGRFITAVPELEIF